MVGFNVIAKQKERAINVLKNIYNISSNEELDNYHQHIQKTFPQYFIQEFLTTNINSDFRMDNCLRYKVLQVFLNSKVRKLRISCFETQYHENLFDLILKRNLSQLKWFDVQGIDLEMPSFQKKFLSIINKNKQLKNLKITNASGNLLTAIFKNCPEIESLLLDNACLLCGLELETIRRWPVIESLKELITPYYRHCQKPKPAITPNDILSKFPNLSNAHGFSHILDILRALTHTTNLKVISDYGSSRQHVYDIRTSCPYLSTLELINPDPGALFHLYGIKRLSVLYLHTFSAYCLQESLNLCGEKLETLRLQAAIGTLDLFRVMDSCSNLSHIEIQDTNIKYTNFEGVIYPKLKTLIIHMKIDHKEPLLNIFKHFPNIQHLELLNWDHLIDSDISFCSQYWTNLKFINISNGNLSIPVVYYLINNCPNIKHIHGLITRNSTFLDDIGDIIALNRKCCFHCNSKTF